jgi:FMN phosphatase YigB (HAD superfamily)
MSGHVTEVVSRELSSHKNQQMEYLADRYRVGPEQLLFIDDALRNVRAVRGRATPWLATWGSARPEHVQAAQQEGIAAVELDGLADSLLRWRESTP